MVLAYALGSPVQARPFEWTHLCDCLGLSINRAARAAQRSRGVARAASATRGSAPRLVIRLALGGRARPKVPPPFPADKRPRSARLRFTPAARNALSVTVTAEAADRGCSAFAGAASGRFIRPALGALFPARAVLHRKRRDRSGLLERGYRLVHCRTIPACSRPGPMSFAGCTGFSASPGTSGGRRRAPGAAGLPPRRGACLQPVSIGSSSMRCACSCGVASIRLPPEGHASSFRARSPIPV